MAHLLSVQTSLHVVCNTSSISKVSCCGGDVIHLECVTSWNRGCGQFHKRPWMTIGQVAALFAISVGAYQPGSTVIDLYYPDLTDSASSHTIKFIEFFQDGRYSSSWDAYLLVDVLITSPGRNPSADVIRHDTRELKKNVKLCQSLIPLRTLPRWNVLPQAWRSGSQLLP